MKFLIGRQGWTLEKKKKLKEIITKMSFSNSALKSKKYILSKQINLKT
jgi:hypothetical protein